MKDRAYDIMKELVELHDREKVLQDELKKIFDEENDIKISIKAADNLKETFNTVMQFAESNKRKQKEEILKLKEEGPTFYDEGGYKWEKMSLSSLLSNKYSLTKEFLSKLNEYGFYYIHDLRFNKDEHTWTDPGVFDFKQIYYNMRGYGTKYNWYDLFKGLSCMTDLYSEAKIINTDFLNIDFEKTLECEDVTTEIDEEFCKNNSISTQLRNALWRNGYKTIADLKLIKDIKIFKQNTRCLGPKGIRSLLELGLI